MSINIPLCNHDPCPMSTKRTRTYSAGVLYYTLTILALYPLRVHGLLTANSSMHTTRSVHLESCLKQGLTVRFLAGGQPGPIEKFGGPTKLTCGTHKLLPHLLTPINVGSMQRLRYESCIKINWTTFD